MQVSIYYEYAHIVYEHTGGETQIINNTANMPELIGSYGQQVKPCFDVDAYNQDINIDEVIAKINVMFPNKR
jgi:hypothetical protein